MKNCFSFLTQACFSRVQSSWSCHVRKGEHLAPLITVRMWCILVGVNAYGCCGRWIDTGTPDPYYLWKMFFHEMEWTLTLHVGLS